MNSEPPPILPRDPQRQEALSGNKKIDPTLLMIGFFIGVFPLGVAFATGLGYSIAGQSILILVFFLVYFITFMAAFYAKAEGKSFLLGLCLGIFLPLPFILLLYGMCGGTHHG